MKSIVSPATTTTVSFIVCTAVVVMLTGPSIVAALCFIVNVTPFDPLDA